MHQLACCTAIEAVHVTMLKHSRCVCMILGFCFSNVRANSCILLNGWTIQWRTLSGLTVECWNLANWMMNWFRVCWTNYLPMSRSDIVHVMNAPRFSPFFTGLCTVVNARSELTSAAVSNTTNAFTCTDHTLWAGTWYAEMILQTSCGILHIPSAHLAWLELQKQTWYVL